jgi:hypothetical protein
MLTDMLTDWSGRASSWHIRNRGDSGPASGVIPRSARRHDTARPRFGTTVQQDVSCHGATFIREDERGGRIVGAQCTWLTPDMDAKLPAKVPRKTYGVVKGAIRHC